MVQTIQLMPLEEIVGVAPTAVVTEEALTTNNKINAKGSTSLDLLTEPGTSNVYKWTVKKGTQSNTVAATQNLVNANIPAGVTNFDFSVWKYQMD